MAANHASTLTAHAFNKSGNSVEQIQRKMLLIAHDFPTFSHSVLFQRFLYFTHPLQVNHHSVLFLMVPTCGLYPRDTEIMNGTINPCDAQKKKQLASEVQTKVAATRPLNDCFEKVRV